MSSPALPTSVPCNICHSEDYTVLYGPGVAQQNQIVRCDTCGLMYASPRKEADCVEMQAWEDDPNWDLEKERPQRFEKERIQVRDYAGSRALLSHLHPGRGRLLEVGSSLGFQLEAFQADGWDVVGVEPSRNASRYATRKLGIRTINSVLEDSAIPSESIDVVVMLHVVEHVPDPMNTVREIYRILRPGGHLIMETPRYDTLMFKLLGRRERSLRCSGHIFFFTTDSLRRLYEQAGFELEKYEAVGRTLTIDRLIYNIGVITNSQSLQRVCATLSRRLGLQNVRISINVRDMQRVCVRKPA